VVHQPEDNMICLAVIIAARMTSHVPRDASSSGADQGLRTCAGCLSRPATKEQLAMSATVGLGERERAVLAGVSTELFVGGQWRPAASGKQIAVEDPSTEEVIAHVADADIADAASAVEAGPAWAASAPRDRGEILRQAFELITARTDDLALLMTLEMGKTLAESKGEIAYPADFFRLFSEVAVRIAGAGRWPRTAPPGGSP
jgi:delta 1-pyrroline-5-carboxylate dehydrogenase